MTHLGLDIGSELWGEIGDDLWLKLGVSKDVIPWIMVATPRTIMTNAIGATLVRLVYEQMAMRETQVLKEELDELSRPRRRF